MSSPEELSNSLPAVLPGDPQRQPLLVGLPPATPGLPRRIVVVTLVHLGLLVAYLMRVNLSVAIVTLGHDETQNGAILGAFFFGYLWTQVPGGWAAARWGGAAVLRYGILLCSLLTLLTVAVAGDVWLLMVARALQGFFQGVVFPSSITLLSKWSPVREQGRLMATAMLGGLVGTVVGLAMSGAICSIQSLGGWAGWQLLFLLHGGLGVAWAALAACALHSSPGVDPTIGLEEYDYIVKGQQTQDKPPAVPWLSILTSVRVWAAISAHLAYNWVFYIFLTCLPKYMMDILHLDLAASGLTSCVPYIAMASVSFAAGYTADAAINAGCSKAAVRRAVMSGGLLGVGGLLVGVSYMQSTVACLTTLIIGFATLGLPSSASQIIFLDLSPNYVGVLQGTSNTFATITGIVAPILTYSIASHGTPEEWQQVFFISAAVAATGALLYGVFGSQAVQPWNAAADSTETPDAAAVSFNSAALRSQSATLIY